MTVVSVRVAKVSEDGICGRTTELIVSTEDLVCCTKS